MTSVYSKVIVLSKKYPVIRGMAAYATIWPVSSLVQQSITGKEKFDFTQALRFCIFGSCFVAPTLHVWLKIAGSMWPQMTIKAAVTKAMVEQISYGPGACVCFFFGMSLLEGKGIEEAGQEVKNKFVPTYKVGFFVWPILQTINFALVPERNRVVYVSICSLLWSSFLAYMKELDAKKPLQKEQITNASHQLGIVRHKTSASPTLPLAL